MEDTSNIVSICLQVMWPKYVGSSVVESYHKVVIGIQKQYNNEYCLGDLQDIPYQQLEEMYPTSGTGIFIW